MPARRRPASRPSPAPLGCALDLACITTAGRDLVVLLVQGPGKAVRLPSAAWRSGADLDAAAGALTRSAVGRDAPWREQVGASATGAHPDRAVLSISYVAVVPSGSQAPAGATWQDVDTLPAALPARHRAIVLAAVAHVRNRMDQVPVAFRLLPPAFTLSDLQEVYELLLGRRLHKASFRRALQAAYLVEPTDEWRSEGRGRPAQFYRYAPRRRRGTHRMMRFDMLDG